MPHTYGSMHHQSHMLHHESPHHLLVGTVQNCEATCEHMITMLINHGDTKSRKLQIQLLRDCADICTLMAKYLARNTHLAKSLAQYCAYVCELCGNTCAQFPDQASQHCAQVCLHCAQECRAFAV